MMSNNVKSAIRTLRLMELFAAAERPLTLSEVAASLAIPKSSAHMLIGTLLAEGYLDEGPRGGYVLPARLAGGWAGGPVGALVRAAAPEMDRLRDAFQETVVLGVPTPALDVRIVAHRISPLAIRYDVSRDPSIPGWATAMGHAILSRLPEPEVRAYLERCERQPLTARTLTAVDDILAAVARARDRGHALNVDERIEGASGAAAPVLDVAGRPRAALNVVTLTPRFRRRQREIVQALAQSAAAIGAAAFGAPSAPPADRPAASGD